MSAMAASATSRVVTVTRLRSGVETPLDQVPGFEIVGERKRAEIVTERRAGARCDRQHSTDPRHDRHVEGAPSRRPGFNGLADRGRHSEYARVSSRHDSDARSLCGMGEGSRGAAHFFAIVGRMAALPWPRSHALEIGPVAIERIGPIERRLRFRGEPARIARAKADDGKMPAHGRVSQPGTSTTAK